MQGLCNRRLRFLYVSVVSPGPSRDSTANLLSALYHQVEGSNGVLPENV